MIIRIDIYVDYNRNVIRRFAPWISYFSSNWWTDSRVVPRVCCFVCGYGVSPLV